MYQAGTTLKINVDFYKHYGIANGKGGVIHASKKEGKVVEESLEKFSDGKKVTVEPNITSQNPTLAVIKARRYLDIPYKLFSANCEHLVRTAHGLEEESRQVHKYLVMAMGVGVASMSDNPTLKTVSLGTAIGASLTSSDESPFVNAAIGGLISFGLKKLSESFKEDDDEYDN